MSNVTSLEKVKAPLLLATDEWGWRNPPEEVIRLAEKSLFAQDTLSGAILVAWGYIDELTCDRLLSSFSKMPKTVDSKHTLEYFADQEPLRVRPYKEQVLALKHGFPFYDRLSLLSTHSAMEDSHVHKRCEDLEAVLMLVDGVSSVVVFSNWESMLSYSTQGWSKEDDVLVRASGGGRPKLAVGARDDISSVLKSYNKDHGDIGTETGAKVWNASSDDLQSPEAKQLARIFDHAFSKGATDITLKPFRNGAVQVLMRRWGKLVTPFAEYGMTSANAERGNGPEQGFVLSPDLASKAINLLASFSGANPDATRKRIPTDGQITYKSTTADAFMRLSFIPLNHLGEHKDLRSVSIRLFARTETSIMLDDLNIPDDVATLIRDAIRRPQGLILISGPVNSGKSTLIAGAIGEHVKVYGDSKKRLSVEDPIERHVYGVIQINTPTHLPPEERYKVILMGIKRHDLNALWVGEVRDSNAAEFCVGFAGSGHLVLTTLHAKDAIVGYDILSNMVDPSVRFQLADSMALSVSLRLVETLCPVCSPKNSWTPPTEDEKRLFALNLETLGEDAVLPEKIAHAKPGGCKDCDNGYAGTRPICEVLHFGRKVKDAAIGMMSGDDVRSQRAIMAESREITLLQSGMRLLQEGEVDLASILLF